MKSQILRPAASLVFALFLTSCGQDNSTTNGDLSFNGDAGIVTDTILDPQQTPPTNRAVLANWLATGVYKDWKCELAVMNARPNGAHGRNRVCSNALISQNTGGPYPVGAASVKELYSGDKVTAYAVAVKVTDGATGASWYWSENATEGVGISSCAGCHAQAPQYGGNDFVYIQVK